jgi:hypothetical protein
MLPRGSSTNRSRNTEEINSPFIFITRVISKTRNGAALNSAVYDGFKLSYSLYIATKTAKREFLFRAAVVLSMMVKFAPLSNY